MSKKSQMIGLVFGRLTVSSEAPRLTSGLRYDCICECGRTHNASGNALKTGKTKSCGCLQAEHRQAGGSAKTHGMASSREYRIWFDMKRRCTNPAIKHFKDYGGRGISFCERWVNFDDFYSDMGDSNGLTLERKDGNGNYEPGNCEWATRTVQARNRRTAHMIEFKGRTMCISEWAETIGIQRGTLKRRIYLGWTVERALTEGVTK